MGRFGLNFFKPTRKLMGVVDPSEAAHEKHSLR